jgi:hypothetical protein
MVKSIIFNSKNGGGFKRSKYTKRKSTKRKYTKRKYTKRKSTKHTSSRRKKTMKRGKTKIRGGGVVFNILKKFKGLTTLIDNVYKLLRDRNSNYNNTMATCLMKLLTHAKANATSSFMEKLNNKVEIERIVCSKFPFIRKLWNIPMGHFPFVPNMPIDSTSDHTDKRQSINTFLKTLFTKIMGMSGGSPRYDLGTPLLGAEDPQWGVLRANVLQSAEESCMPNSVIVNQLIKDEGGNPCKLADYECISCLSNRGVGASDLDDYTESELMTAAASTNLIDVDQGVPIPYSDYGEEPCPHLMCRVCIGIGRAYNAGLSPPHPFWCPVCGRDHPVRDVPVRDVQVMVDMELELTGVMTSNPCIGQVASMLFKIGIAGAAIGVLIWLAVEHLGVFIGLIILIVCYCICSVRWPCDEE